MAKLRQLTAAQALADSEGERVLVRFCEAIDDGGVPDTETLAVLYEAFQKIRKGVPPQKALNLQRKRGQKGQPTERHDQLAAAMVDRIDGDMRYESAASEVAEKFHSSARQVGRYYSAHKSVIRVMRHIDQHGISALARHIENSGLPAMARYLAKRTDKNFD